MRRGGSGISIYSIYHGLHPRLSIVGSAAADPIQKPFQLFLIKKKNNLFPPKLYLNPIRRGGSNLA